MKLEIQIKSQEKITNNDIEINNKINKLNKRKMPG